MLLGIDTSNYTTSAAVYDAKENKAINFKRPLPVKAGEKGLRQSDAVFHHTVNLPEVITDAFKYSRNVTAVGVSVRPRDVEGSYMPCFRSGYAAAVSVSSALDIPLFEFSHQAGHIAAALYSAGRLDLIDKRFIAFHFSGGTSEAVLVEPDDSTVFSCKIVSQSSDLKAGQVIDRCGVMLGLGFPCGAELEKLALTSRRSYNAKPSFHDGNISLSGVENKFNDMFSAGDSKNDIARFTIDCICRGVIAMTDHLLNEYGELPLVYAGGVMSNSIIRRTITEKYNGIFALPEFSTDNASGIAVLTAYKGGMI